MHDCKHVHAQLQFVDRSTRQHTFQYVYNMSADIASCDHLQYRYNDTDRSTLLPMVVYHITQTDWYNPEDNAGCLGADVLHAKDSMCMTHAGQYFVMNNRMTHLVGM